MFGYRGKLAQATNNFALAYSVAMSIASRAIFSITLDHKRSAMSVLKHLGKLKMDPNLLKLLKTSARAVKKMTPAERKAMHEAQSASWCRQDLD